MASVLTFTDIWQILAASENISRITCVAVKRSENKIENVPFDTVEPSDPLLWTGR